MTPAFGHLIPADVQAAVRRTRALAASFHRSGKVFRERYDAHVQAWKRFGSREAYVLYHTDPAFAAAHDAREAELRAEPMPGWNVRPINNPAHAAREISAAMMALGE